MSSSFEASLFVDSSVVVTIFLRKLWVTKHWRRGPKSILEKKKLQVTQEKLGNAAEKWEFGVNFTSWQTGLLPKPIEIHFFLNATYYFKWFNCTFHIKNLVQSATNKSPYLIKLTEFQSSKISLKKYSAKYQVQHCTLQNHLPRGVP